MTDKTNVSKPRIIQLLITPNNSTWQSILLGLGNDGVTYRCGHYGTWEPYIPPVKYKGDIE